MIAYLLLSLACGWTLVEGAVTSKSSSPINPEALGEDHPATMFIFALVILTIILQLLNKLILFDDFTKFHDYESWPGFLLVFVRAVLSGVFSYQIRQTIKYQIKSRGGGGRVGAFMSKLEVLGEATVARRAIKERLTINPLDRRSMVLVVPVTRLHLERLCCALHSPPSCDRWGAVFPDRVRLVHPSSGVRT